MWLGCMVTKEHLFEITFLTWYDIIGMAWFMNGMA